MTIEEKIREYYFLKQAINFASKKLNRLNKKIKKELDPGEHTFHQYRAVIAVTKKYEIDETAAFEILDPVTYYRCLRHTLDSDLIESAYLREDITDEQFEQIRGEVKLITSLTVDENVQSNI